MSTTLTSKAKAGLLSQRTRFNHWLINDGKRKLALGMWILLMVIIYIIGVIYYGFSDNYTDVRALFGSTLLISRAATLNLHLISAVILLPVCRTLISALRQTPLNRIIPLDDNLVLHRWMGWSILIFAVIHTMGHAFNFRNLTIKDPDGTGASWGTRYFLSGPGWTGWTMLCLLLVIAITALDRFKKVNFERFWYTHHLVFLFILLFSFHGSWCFIPKDREPKCSEAGTFWRYWVVSGFIYTLERIAREWRSARSTKIIKVIQHPSDVVEVQFNKDPGIQVKAGQYIFLCCPTISLCQWHPFTLTSAPEEDYLSVHIRCVGDFTRAFARQLGCEISVGSRKISEKEKTLSSGKEPSTQYLLLPQVQLDGPFGSASEDVFKYEVAMMFGAGIGVTPFASVLKSVWYRLNRPERSCRLYKLYFYWTCRDYKAFEWFQDLLLAIEKEDKDHLIEINVYMTGRLKPDEICNVTVNADMDVLGGDALTGLNSATQYGRPNLNHIFQGIRAKHREADVGLFFCGPPPMGKSLQQACNDHSDASEEGTRFYYHQEWVDEMGEEVCAFRGTMGTFND